MTNLYNCANSLFIPTRMEKLGKEREKDFTVSQIDKCNCSPQARSNQFREELVRAHGKEE